MSDNAVIQDLSNSIGETRRTLDGIILNEVKEVRHELNNIREHDIRDLRGEFKDMCGDLNNFKLKTSEDLGWIKAKLTKNGNSKDRGLISLINLFKRLFVGGA